MDIKDIRLKNLLRLISEYKSQREFCDLIEKDSSYISQLKNPSNPKNIGEKMARRIEQKTGKPTGWLDIQETSLNEGGKNKNGSVKSVEAKKLTDIIDEAEQALINSGMELSSEQQVEYYLEVIEYAGRKHFSDGFIKQYVSEILEQSVSDT